MNIQGGPLDADMVHWKMWDECHGRNCHVAKMVVDQRMEKLRLFFEELEFDSLG